jgi:hypothetical protein
MSRVARSRSPSRSRPGCRYRHKRHTFASPALASGKSVRWSLRSSAIPTPPSRFASTRALREEETDLSFLDAGGTRRHPRGTERRAVVRVRKPPPRATPRRGKGIMARREGELCEAERANPRPSGSEPPGSGISPRYPRISVPGIAPRASCEGKSPRMRFREVPFRGGLFRPEKVRYDRFQAEMSRRKPRNETRARGT